MTLAAEWLNVFGDAAMPAAPTESYISVGVEDVMKQFIGGLDREVGAPLTVSHPFGAPLWENAEAHRENKVRKK